MDLAYIFCSSVNPDDEEEALQFYLEKLKERLPHDASPTMKQLTGILGSGVLRLLSIHEWLGVLGIGWGLDKLDGGTKLKSEQAYDEAVRREFG
jgi:hypothetical protein